jgi:bifunctional non-homologous end joining protein LigD
VEVGESSEGLEQCVIDDVASLVWVANLASLELHTLQATVDAPERPTSLVLDLDPGPPAGILDCCRIALRLGDLLDDLALTSVVKTSGSKGLHVAVPVSGADSDHTKAFARALGQRLAEDAPKEVTIVMARDRRGGKVFVDWSQNDRHKTTVAAYSLRAQPRPTVSTPVSWDEVADALERDDTAALSLEAPDVLERVDDLGDLYAPNLTEAARLPALSKVTS